MCKNILALMHESKKEDFGSSESRTIVTKDDIVIYVALRFDTPSSYELGVPFAIRDPKLSCIAL